MNSSNLNNTIILRNQTNLLVRTSRSIEITNKILTDTKRPIHALDFWQSLDSLWKAILFANLITDDKSNVFENVESLFHNIDKIKNITEYDINRILK
jgi:hypothetical protein